MEQLRTPDGIVCVTVPQRDIPELCRTYISDDVAEYVGQIIEGIDAEAQYAQMRFNSDMDALEGENEFYRDKLFDLKSELEILLDEMDKAKRINTGKIYAKLTTMAMNIGKDL